MASGLPQLDVVGYLVACRIAAFWRVSGCLLCAMLLPQWFSWLVTLLIKAGNYVCEFPGSGCFEGVRQKSYRAVEKLLVAPPAERFDQMMFAAQAL
jgi:hypothetical protein